MRLVPASRPGDALWTVRSLSTLDIVGEVKSVRYRGLWERGRRHVGVARVHFCGKNAIFAERFGGLIRQCEELLVCKCIELIHTVLTQNCAHAM